MSFGWQAGQFSRVWVATVLQRLQCRGETGDSVGLGVWRLIGLLGNFLRYIVRILGMSGVAVCVTGHILGWVLVGGQGARSSVPCEAQYVSAFSSSLVGGVGGFVVRSLNFQNFSASVLKSVVYSG